MQDCPSTLQAIAGMMKTVIKQQKGSKIYEKNTDFRMGSGRMPCPI